MTDQFARFWVSRDDGTKRFHQAPFDRVEILGRLNRVEKGELTALERAALLEVDALSARLAQECALRAQAERERGEAWDKADFEAEAAEKAEASLRDVETRLRAMELSRDEANHRYDVERRRGDAIRRRLREYEEHAERCQVCVPHSRTECDFGDTDG